MKKTLAVVIGMLVVLAGCASSIQESKSGNTNPRSGWVLVTQGRGGPYVQKICDGTTLLYSSHWSNTGGGLAAIPNSPECQPG